MELTKDMMEALAQPFSVDAVQWKPGSTTKDKSRGLALAYVDSRFYQDQLNNVIGPGWSDIYEVQVVGNKVIVTGALTIGDTTRSDVGESELSDPNAVTTAKAQCFKRCCTAYGLGRYLYSLPSRWETFDPERKSFTKEALARLQQAVSSRNGALSHNGDRYGDGSPLNGNAAERDAYRAYVQAMGKPPASVTALREWYAAKNDN